MNFTVLPTSQEKEMTLKHIIEATITAQTCSIHIYYWSMILNALLPCPLLLLPHALLYPPPSAHTHTHTKTRTHATGTNFVIWTVAIPMIHGIYFIFWNRYCRNSYLKWSRIPVLSSSYLHYRGLCFVAWNLFSLTSWIIYGFNL